ncbi:hypothetical protein M5689_000396 [Euphorbia peplus]|nr:hypothetical protein M5689_000396 [Euphorbia peplus]
MIHKGYWVSPPVTLNAMAELLVVVIPPPVPCVGLPPKALTQRMFDVLLTLGHPAPVEGIFRQPCDGVGGSGTAVDQQQGNWRFGGGGQDSVSGVSGVSAAATEIERVRKVDMLDGVTVVCFREG